MLLLFTLLLLQEPPTLDALLKELRSGNLDQQDAATEKLLARHKDWSEADLARLKEAQKDADPGFAERAKSALASIEVRRRLGDRLLRKVKKIDEVVLGEVTGRGRVLLSTVTLMRVGELTSEDVKTIVTIAVEQKWELSPDLLLPMAGQPELQPLLVLLLTSSKPATRSSAIQAFGRIGAWPLAEAIAALAKDPDVAVRGAVAQGLARLDAREQAKTIAALLKDASPAVRALAAVAAGDLRVCKTELAELETDKDPQVRLAGLEAEARHGVDLAGKCADLLSSKDREIRAAAIDLIGRARVRKEVESVLAMMKDESKDVRHRTVVALGRINVRSDAVLSALQAAADDQEAPDAMRTAVAASRLRLQQKKGPEWSDVFRLNWRRLEPQEMRETLEAAAATYDPRTWERLDEPLTLPRDISNAREAIVLLIEWGIAPRGLDNQPLVGRLSAGRRITPREILDRLLAPGTVLVPDGPRLNVLSIEEARVLWLSRIEKK